MTLKGVWKKKSVALSDRYCSNIFLFWNGNSCRENFTWCVVMIFFMNVKGPCTTDCEPHTRCFYSMRLTLSFSLALLVQVNSGSAVTRTLWIQGHFSSAHTWDNGDIFSRDFRQFVRFDPFSRAWILHFSAADACLQYRCSTWTTAGPSVAEKPIEEHTYQLAAAHLPVSWARPALKIALLGTRSNRLF